MSASCHRMNESDETSPYRSSGAGGAVEGGCSGWQILPLSDKDD